MIRRLLIAALLSAPLAACQTAQQPSRRRRAIPHGISAPSRTSRTTSRWSTAARWRPKYARQTVEYKGPEKPGSIVVDIDERMLYLVQPEGRAIRYGVGVGKQGFSWRGIASVGRKGVWPDWSPTKTMVGIKPELPRYMRGRPRQPARRPRPLPAPERRRHALPHPRHQRALVHRRAGLLRLRAHAERGRGRPLRARPRRHDGLCQAQRALPGVTLVP